MIDCLGVLVTVTWRPEDVDMYRGGNDGTCRCYNAPVAVPLAVALVGAGRC